MLLSLAGSAQQTPEWMQETAAPKSGSDAGSLAVSGVLLAALRLALAELLV